MTEHLDASNTPTVLLRIEDPAAVENIEAIAAVEGISGLFIGPADLAVAYCVNDATSSRVTDTVKHVIAVARRHKVPVASFAPSKEAAKVLFDQGVTLVTWASEHSAMQNFFSADVLAGLLNSAPGQ